MTLNSSLSKPALSHSPLRRTSDSSFFTRILLAQSKCFLIMKIMKKVVAKHEEKKQLWRQKRRWKDIIKRNFKVTENESVN
jgi:hypothetical protein